MNTVIRGMTGHLVLALSGGLDESPFWELAKGHAAVVCQEIILRPGCEDRRYEDLLDTLMIAMLQTRLVIRARTDDGSSYADVEEAFRQQCPEWLAIQLGICPGVDLWRPGP